MPTSKLLEQVRNVARMRHLSLSTERAYVGWIRRFILFHNKKHPKEMAEREIRQFSSLRVVSCVSWIALYGGLKNGSTNYTKHTKQPETC